MANKRVLNYKIDSIIAEYAESENITLREAIDVFYKSDLYNLIVNGVSDMHCRSNAYLIEELNLEIAQKLEEQNQISEKLQNRDIVFFTTLFVKELHKTLISLPVYIKEKTGEKCTPFKFFKVVSKISADTVFEFSQTLYNQVVTLINLGVTIPEIAEEINADREDVREFYERHKLIAEA